MPLPLIPLALSIAGSLAPSIINALAGSKTEAEAKAAVAPQYNAMLQRLMAEGLGRVEAQRAADEALLPEVQKAKEEGALPGWAEAGLSLAGGIGGWAAGAKLAAKGIAKAAGAVGEQVLSKATPKAIPKLTGGDGPVFPGNGPIPMRGSPPAAKTAEFEVRTKTKNTPRTEFASDTTMDGVPLNIDQAAGDTGALADAGTHMLDAFPGLAATRRINPKLAQTEVLDPNLTRLMAAFPG